MISVRGEPAEKLQKLDFVSPPDTVPVTTEESSSDEEFVPTTDDKAEETWFTDDEDDDNDNETNFCVDVDN